MENVTIITGGREPFPLPELAIGNIVRLKEPYLIYGDRVEPSGIFTMGIIVEHVSRNWMGIPKVGLILFDNNSRLHCELNGMPSYCDFPVNQIILLKVCGVIGYEIINDGRGHDLHPRCTGCGDQNQHPFGDERCPQCHGFGFVKEMVRLPQ